MLLLSVLMSLLILYPPLQEREAERKRTEELQDENLALSLAQRRLMEESQHLGWELDQLTKTTESSQGKSC